MKKMIMIFMILPLLAAAIPGLIAAAGQIGGSLLQRHQSVGDINRQNQYNTPANQLARLREAGLPYAAFAGGQAGNQSALPQSNDSGIKEAGTSIGSFISTQMQLKQMKLLDEQIKTQQQITNKTQAEAHILGNTESANNMSPNDIPVSDQARTTRAATDTAEAIAIVNKNQAEISKLNLETIRKYSDQQAKAILNKTLIDIGLAIQARNRGLAMDTLLKQLQKGGITPAEAFIHSILTGMLGVKELK